MTIDKTTFLSILGGLAGLAGVPLVNGASIVMSAAAHIPTPIHADMDSVMVQGRVLPRDCAMFQLDGQGSQCQWFEYHPRTDDVLATGADLKGMKGFLLTEHAMRVALGAEWQIENLTGRNQLKRTFRYYDDVIRATPSTYDVVDDIQLFGTEEPISRPQLLVADPTTGDYGRIDVDFGNVIVDGKSGEQRTRVLELANAGMADLIIKKIQIVGNPQGFSLSELAPNTRVLPDQSISFTLTFDPLVSGPSSFDIVISTNEPEGITYKLPVTGFGLSPTGDIRIESPNTNLGGLALGAVPKRVEQLATITNIGAQPLEIYDIRVIEGADQFAVGGLPQAISKNTPLVLQPNQSQTLGVLFDAAKLGLQKGVIQIYTNDPEKPIQRLTVIGTGLPDGVGPFDLLGKKGHDYVAVQPDRGSEPVQRTVSDAEGTWAVTVTPNTLYRVVAFDPESGLTAEGLVNSDAQGRLTNDAFGYGFGASTEPDKNGNGMPDDIDFAMGTAAPKPATSNSPAPGSSSLPTGGSLLGWSEKHRRQPVSRTLRNAVVGSVHTTRFNPSLFGWLDVMRTDDVLSTRRR